MGNCCQKTGSIELDSNIENEPQSLKTINHSIHQQIPNNPEQQPGNPTLSPMMQTRLYPSLSIIQDPSKSSIAQNPLQNTSVSNINQRKGNQMMEQGLKLKAYNQPSFIKYPEKSRIQTNEANGGGKQAEKSRNETITVPKPVSQLYPSLI